MLRFFSLLFLFAGVLMVIHGSYEEKYQMMQRRLQDYKDRLEEAQETQVSGYEYDNSGFKLDNAFDAFPSS